MTVYIATFSLLLSIVTVINDFIKKRLDLFNPSRSKSTLSRRSFNEGGGDEGAGEKIQFFFC